MVGDLSLLTGWFLKKFLKKFLLEMFFHHIVRVPPFYKMFSLHAPMLRIINFTQLLHCTLEDSQKNRDGLFVLGYVTIFQHKIKKVCYNDYTMYSTELLWENILLHCFMMMMSKLNV